MNGIERCRKRAGMSQGELAKQLGVDQSAVSRWETGDTAPRMKMLPRICQVLGCKLDELLEDTSVQHS